MATHIITTVTCDLHEGDLVEAQHTVRVGLNGSTTEVDLCDDHHNSVAEFLAVIQQHGRSVAGKRQAPRNLATPTPAPAAPIPERVNHVVPVVDQSTRRAMREWAEASGYEVGARGRVPAVVQQAYLAAGGKILKGTQGGKRAKKTADA